MGARFSAPVGTGPGAHPASYIMGTRSFPGIKRPGRGVDHPLPSGADVKERVELWYTSTPPLGHRGLLWGAFAKLEKRLLASSCLSVRPHAWNNSDPPDGFL